jgi:Fungal Zn(2)-Cys(6) binuclear cluster domain
MPTVRIEKDQGAAFALPLPTTGVTVANLGEQCDGTYPVCSPCQSKGVECTYGVSKRR